MIYIPDDSDEHDLVLDLLSVTKPILEPVLDNTEDMYEYFNCFVFPV